jgi:flagellar motor switch/type III secretory pathway protein FliN
MAWIFHRLPGSSLRWFAFELQAEDEQWTLLVAFSQELSSIFDPAAFKEVLEQDKNTSLRTGVSKTFDLLLDVPLPISVSFGKTALQLREVLKLKHWFDCGIGPLRF